MADEIRASVRLRVSTFPDDPDGRNVFAVFEEIYGTGVFVELVNGDRLQLRSRGSADATTVCGPLERSLHPNEWYGVRVEAEKSDDATVTLELLDAMGTVVEAITCTHQRAGGGVFTDLRAGNMEQPPPSGSVDFDDVVVTLASGPGDPAGIERHVPRL
jgi:hypothetical protein